LPGAPGEQLWTWVWPEHPVVVGAGSIEALQEETLLLPEPQTKAAPHAQNADPLPARSLAG
jgi:hypothetical protein